MSIIFSAIVPHSPLLLPEIGKQNTKRLEATLRSYKIIEEELYASQPEIIVIISPHGIIQPNSFSINLNPIFYINFNEFGDFSSNIEVTGNIALAYKIKERLETKLPLQLVSIPNLDHGIGIPIKLLMSHLPKIKIMPVYYSGLNIEAHYKFGIELRRDLLVSNSRVAVIASADLSHKLTKDGPAGYSIKAKRFDKKVIDCLLNSRTEELLKIDEKTLHDAGECGFKAIVMLSGIMYGAKYEPRLLSYEFPFGVGYLVMNLKI